jgi:hypothetical protein
MLSVTWFLAFHCALVCFFVEHAGDLCIIALRRCGLVCCHAIALIYIVLILVVRMDEGILYREI